MSSRRNPFRYLILLAMLVGSLAAASPAGAAGGGVQCLRQQTPPTPAPGGAVFARPITGGGSDPNVVVIPASASWTASGSCAGSAAAAQVMTHPTSIMVGSGAAVLLKDQPAGLSSAWGAQDVTADDPAPVLFPGRNDWTTTEADVVDQSYLLNVYNSCRACALARSNFTPVQGIFPNLIAYSGDLTGADLRGATLSGTFQGWNFTQTNLSGAVINGAVVGSRLDHTIVDGTTFAGTDLRGTQLTALQYGVPPSFAGVRLGPYNGACTTFRNTDLARGTFDPLKPDPGCETSPLFPNSSVRLGLLHSLVIAEHAPVDFANAQLVATSADRSALAGDDLSGVNLTGASFTGYPANLAGVKFNNASLQHATFTLATLSGATFTNANAAGASFEEADLAASGQEKGANFSGPKTNLQGADFVGADVSGASFIGVDISGAVLSRALAVDTDFNGVRAENTVFNGAHIYGDGQAFDSATDLRGADFGGAVLAGAVSLTGGFDFTHTDLTGAKFDGAQCIGCNFTGSKLGQVNFGGAYLPGAVFSGVLSLTDANLVDAWLYCGDQNNSSCPSVPGSPPRWSWPLALGSREAYGPVPFAATNLTGVSLGDVAVCPDGKDGSANPAGCAGHLLPDPNHAPAIPAACSAAGPEACPTATSTLFDATSVGSPLAVVPATPPTWATLLTGRGDYAGFDDGTIRLVGAGAARIVAGQAGKHCSVPTAACGDGGPAGKALLGTPAGLAVGLDGALYVADPALHRVRRIDPAGNITTVAGDGVRCTGAAGDCGDGGPATDASLAGPDGVWISPAGDLYIADGPRGIREVAPNGTITTIGAANFDVQSVVGEPNGDLYAATSKPDYLIEIPTGGEVTKVVGTGTSGYNGNTDSLGLLSPGTSVQINHPQSLSIARNGDVVFADTANNLIRAYVPSSGHVIDVLAGLVSNGAPQQGFNGDGHWGDQTELNRPLGVAVVSGSLYVIADSGNRRIRQLGPSPLLASRSLGRPAPVTCQVSLAAAGSARRGRDRRGQPVRCTRSRLLGAVRRAKGVLVLATISRGRVIYATGSGVVRGRRQLRLALIEVRRLRRGRYTLTLRTHRRHRRIGVRRIKVVVR